MYIRAPSPDSTNCCGSLAPLAPLISSSDSTQGIDDGGGDKFPSSPLYSTVSSDSRAADKETSNISRPHDGPTPLRRLETELLLPRAVESRFGSKSNCSTDISNSHPVVEEEDQILFSFVSPCNKSDAFFAQGRESVQNFGSRKEEQRADSTSVLQDKWSASSSTDSLKSINLDDENDEGRNSHHQLLQKSALLTEGALFYRGCGAQQQRPGSSSIGLHRKWSDSSCSLDSIDQEEDDKNTHGLPGSRHYDNRVRFKESFDLTHKKWSSSNGSLDSVENDEEDHYESPQFPPLLEAVRVKEPLSPIAHLDGNIEGPVLSSSSSSIGNHSGNSSGSVVSDADSPGDMEVESTLRSGSVSQLNLSSLESSLPIRRGLSRFWNGKAKSFASLQDVSSLASLADLAKPENPFNKRRKFSSGFGLRPATPLTRPNTAGISKKPPSGTGKSCLAIAVAMGNKVENGPKCLSPQSALRNAQRSFSLSDLEQHRSNTDTAPPPPGAAAATMTRMRRS